MRDVTKYRMGLAIANTILAACVIVIACGTFTFGIIVVYALNGG